MRVLLAALGVLSVVGSAAAAGGGGGVHTLYRSPGGPITAFAQDDSVLAWFSPGRRRCNVVHLLSLKGVSATLPKPGTSNVTCRWSVGDGQTRLALASRAGDSTLWTLHQNAQIALDYVVGAAAESPRERRFSQVAHTRAGAGLWLGGIAGSGSTLVYATTEVAYVDQVACLSGGSCRLKVAGGSVRRIVGRRNPAVPGAGPAVDVAAAAGRIAYIPAAAVGAHGLPRAAAGRPVVVRSARRGELVSRAVPQGVPEGIALAPHVLALVEQKGERRLVAWYEVESGRLLGEVRVPPKTGNRIAANDGIVVYRVGRVIRGIDVSTGQVRRLAKAAATPLGLSISGNRLAWAENVRGVGRIRALMLGAG